ARNGGIIFLSSTIVAQDGAPTNVDLDLATANYFVDHSLIGNKDGAGANFHDNHGNLLGSTGAEIDPLLAPLAFNGGSTQTHALKAGSPCIHKGANPHHPPSDQPGPPFTRKLGHAVDIGAYERQ